MQEIVAAAKANPDKWSFATAQLGAPGHLAAVAFNQYNGINLPIIVYRGTAPAANDVVGGHVPMMIEAILSLLPMVRAGSVRAVAVTSTKRSLARRRSRPWRRSACRRSISAPGGRCGDRRACRPISPRPSTAGSTTR